MLDKKAVMEDEQLRKDEKANEQRDRRIKNLEREFEEFSLEFQGYKEDTLRDKSSLETRLYTEIHTRDILTEVKSIQNTKIGEIKADNQNMNRAITKDKYHNNREEKAKEKKRV